MAIGDVVHAVEYLKESMKLYVAKVTNMTSGVEAIGMPDEVTRDLLADIAGFFEPELLKAAKVAAKEGGFSMRSPENRRLLSGLVDRAVDKFTARAAHDLLNELDDLGDSFAAQLEKGVPMERITAVLESDKFTNELHKKMQSIIGREAVNTINRVMQDVDDLAAQSRKDAGIEDLETWVTVEDKNVCEDCAARHGQQKTREEWRSEGLPGSPLLLCSSFGKRQCRCRLKQGEAAGGPVNVTKQLERARKKAAKRTFEAMEYDDFGEFVPALAQSFESNLEVN